MGKRYLQDVLKRGDEKMYLVFVMSIYFTIRDVQLIGEWLRKKKAKRKLPELQQPMEVEDDSE